MWLLGSEWIHEIASSRNARKYGARALERRPERLARATVAALM
jgi:hypothetical protein